MAKAIQKRIHWVNCRFTAAEYETLQTLLKQSTCRTVSEYIRKLVLNKPIIVRTRNQSLDDYLADMVSLRADLKSIANNFDQAVHRLHTLERTSDIQHWLLNNEQDKTKIVRQIEAINTRINQIYHQWSQE